MRVTDITPDQVIVWQWGAVVLNATILYTWVVILVLAGGAWLLTRRVSAGPGLGRWQNLLEVLVGGTRSQLREIGGREAERYLPFIGSLFLFIAAANFLSLVPGYHAPTGSLSTTAALALCVFVAVPLHGIARQGLRGYLAQYVRPNPFMLPFNVIGELSRTLALAVRLFGNVMSTGKIVAILLAIAPLFFPVVMQALELLTGLIQAYIFAVLATVYIASASRVEPGAGRPQPRGKQHG